MLENPNFERNKNSISSTGVYKIANGIIRAMKWICYYETINYLDLMGSICKYLNELS